MSDGVRGGCRGVWGLSTSWKMMFSLSFLCHRQPHTHTHAHHSVLPDTYRYTHTGFWMYGWIRKRPAATCRHANFLSLFVLKVRSTGDIFAPVAPVFVVFVVIQSAVGLKCPCLCYQTVKAASFSATVFYFYFFGEKPTLETVHHINFKDMCSSLFFQLMSDATHTHIM